MVRNNVRGTGLFLGLTVLTVFLAWAATVRPAVESREIREGFEYVITPPTAAEPAPCLGVTITDAQTLEDEIRCQLADQNPTMDLSALRVGIRLAWDSSLRESVIVRIENGGKGPAAGDFTFVWPGLEQFQPIVHTPAGSCTPPPSGMAGWWTLDEVSGTTAYDSAGANDGSYVTLGTPSPTPTSGMVGPALSFDGVDDWVSCGTSSTVRPTTAVTVDAWVFPRSLAGSHTVVSYSGSSNRGYQLVFHAASGNLVGQIGDGTNDYFLNLRVPLSQFTTNHWYHLALTFDGLVGRIYVDGVQAAQYSKPATLFYGSGTRCAVGASADSGFGSDPNGARTFFDGVIDEVEIFDRALTPTEVQNLYAAGSEGKCKPPCGDTTDDDVDGIGNACDNCASVFNPSQADADADLIGDDCDACTDTDVDGWGDPGFPANTCGTDDCPTVANPAQTDTDGDGAGDDCDTCTDTDGDGWGNPGFPLNTCPLDNCPTTTNPSQAEADGDGIGDDCDACTDTDGDGWGDPGFPSNTCAVDNCPTVANPTQANADGDAVGDDCDTCTDTDSDGWGDPGFPVNTCAPDNCPTVANPGQQDLDHDGIGEACEICTPPPSGMVGWWALDEAAGTTAFDSALANDGVYKTLTAPAPTPASGKVGLALRLDGVNDWVDCGTSATLRPATALTIDAWVFPRSLASTHTVASYAFSSANGYQLLFHAASGNLIGQIGDGTSDYFLNLRVPLSQFTTNRWYHLALTFDGLVGRIYVDGVQADQYSKAATLSYVATRCALGAVVDFGPGSDSNGARNWFNGEIDEVEIFNRALTPTEIQDLYLSDSRGKCKPCDPIDTDGDTIGNACDNCPTVSNPSQNDSDGDESGAACDCNDSNAGIYPGAPELCDNLDNDCDGEVNDGFGALPELCNGLDDNCNGDIDEGNPGSGASCSTGLPGVCGPGTQACIGGSLQCEGNSGPGPELCNGADDDCDGIVDDAEDTDTDGTGDCSDNCPTGYNPSQANGDGDGFGDDCDCAPTDPANGQAAEVNNSVRLTKSGGVANLTWSSGAGPFRLYRGYKSPGTGWAYNHYCIGPAVSVSAAQDTLVPRPNVLFYYLVTREGCMESIPGRDSALAPISNADPCPSQGTDADGDDLEEADDNCPGYYNPEQEDDDGDGHGDVNDPPEHVCDNCITVSNVLQENLDADDLGDACDPDDDGDLVDDASDNCPTFPNAGQEDTESGGGDGVGDACDNCPAHHNPGQEDDDDDGIGNACDS